jgi:hypothetical protein
MTARGGWHEAKVVAAAAASILFLVASDGAASSCFLVVSDIGATSFYRNPESAIDST